MVVAGAGCVVGQENPRAYAMAPVSLPGVSAEPAAEAPLPETLPAPQAVPAGMSLDQAISATLMADPKIRAGLEAIHQANADWLTSSLPPNPTLLTDGHFPAAADRLRPTDRAGPRKLTCKWGIPIDWFLFGKRAAAMASASLGVRQSEADYADLIRQRVTATATAFYDVLEAKSLLDLARQDTENLTRLEAATRKAVDAGGRPVVELNRVRLDLLKSQQDLREAESALADRQGQAASAVRPHRRRPILRRGRQSRRALDCGTAARRGGVCPGPGRTVPTFSPCESRFPRPRRIPSSSGERRFRRSRPNSATPGSIRPRSVRRTPIPGTLRLPRPLPLFDRNQGNRAKAQSVAAQNCYNLQAGLVDLRAEIEEAVQDFSTAYQNARSVAQEQLKLAAEVRDSIAKAYDAGGRP